jgi:L-2-hydroxyglutarate oxidase LhgO
MSDVQTIVVGGGVVGLAIAARLARNEEVMVVEQQSLIGQGISARNSEVIHAGIYYKMPLKAMLCVRGKSLLYEYCKERHIPHAQIGKLIVATQESEADELDKLMQQAEANGVMDLVKLDQAEIKQLEPQVTASAGLLSPSSGVISAYDLCLSLSGDVTNRGGQVVTNSQVLRVDRKSPSFALTCRVDWEDFVITCDRLVVAAGFGGHTLVDASPDLKRSDKAPALYLCKGRYFSYSGPSPFKRLIYPVPEKNMVGLGIHATLDVSGQVKFGPDTEYVDSEDYSMPAEIPGSYVAAIRKYFPAVEQEKLTPDYAGIRPKLAGPDAAARDFQIDGPDHHGIENYVQLFGIESPGLTSSLAIAEYVQELF